MSAVFFDLYGTLFLPPDGRSAGAVWRGALMGSLKAAGAVGREFDDALWESLPAPASDPGLSLFECRIRSLGRALGVELQRARLAEAAAAACEAWQALIRLDPDARPVLEGLRRDRIVRLVSNFDHPPHVRGVLRREGIDGLFDRVVISGEVGASKPDPAIFDHALGGLEPADVTYVGDSIVDYEAAVAAGIRPILIRRRGQASGEVPRNARYADADAHLAALAAAGRLLTVRSLAELPGLLS